MKKAILISLFLLISQNSFAKTIVIGNDHKGYLMKIKIKKYLEKRKINVIDVGSFNEESVDFPDYSKKVAEKLKNHSDYVGILICNTGTATCLHINKYKHIRGIIGYNLEVTKESREHSDANVLCLGGGILTEDESFKIVDMFLNTEFVKEEKYLRRVKKVSLDGSV